jgi:uncharacterized protein YmfQ (DUF2313 family)
LGLTVVDFQQGVSGAIPRRYADTVQGQVRASIAAAWAGDLSERESDPGQAVELLADWKRANGRPDHCSPLNATIRSSIRYWSRGSQARAGSRAYYVAVAAALGYTITIIVLRRFRVSRLALQS